jgi:hypothetical protein
MARRPPPGIAASSPPSGGGKRYWIVRLDARLSRPPPAAVGGSQAGATASNHGTLLTPQRRLTRTEPANHELALKALHVATPSARAKHFASDTSSTFRTLPAHLVSLAPVPHPSFAGVHTTSFSFVSVCALHSHASTFLSCRCASSIRMPHPNSLSRTFSLAPTLSGPARAATATPARSLGPRL